MGEIFFGKVSSTNLIYKHRNEKIPYLPLELEVCVRNFIDENMTYGTQNAHTEWKRSANSDEILWKFN